MENQSLILQNLLDIKETLGKLDSKIDSVHDQAIKTNGRVNKLEENVSDLKSLEDERKGKNIVWGSIGGLVGALLVAYFKKMFNL